MNNPINPGEMLDLVDEKDEVVGKVDISGANQNPKMIHREVGIFIFDGEKRVLVQQRSLKKRHAPGIWTIAAAGHVSAGMSYEETAHKELLEELGFDTKLVFLRKILDRRETETRFLSLFIGKYDGQKITLEEDEVDQVKFISQEELDEFSKNHKLSTLSESTILEFWEGKFDKVIQSLSCYD